jgi:hypothetical protein
MVDETPNPQERLDAFKAALKADSICKPGVVVDGSLASMLASIPWFDRRQRALADARASFVVETKAQPTGKIFRVLRAVNDSEGSPEDVVIWEHDTQYAIDTADICQLVDAMIHWMIDL